MFNETFWFFYWINVAGNIVGFAVAITAVMVLAGVVCLFIGECEDDKQVRRWTWQRCLPVAVSAFLIATFIPPAESFYGGATQYLGTTTELDETLINLKGLVDQKILDLTTTD